MIAYSDKDKKIIGGITILSGILAAGCLGIGLLSVQFNFEVFSDPVLLLDMEGASAMQMRWFMLLDMFGYYLLLLPVIFYIHRKLKQKTVWAECFTSLGFAYVLIGAIGAAILAVVWPALMEHYGMADAASREIYKANFILTNDMVSKGMWNQLEELLCGVWWLAVGLIATEGKALKIVTIILGISCLADGFGELFQIAAMAEIGLNLYLVLAIIWPFWVGVAMIRGKF